MTNTSTHFQKMINPSTESCNKILFSILGKQELVDQWWKSHNKFFNDSPLNVPIEVVFQYLLGYVNK